MNTILGTIRNTMLGAAVSLPMLAAHAGLVEIKFGTSNVTVQSDFALVLAGAGINPSQPINGRFYYESTTGDTDATAGIGQYNGTVDSLSFSVGSWFSQSLTNIAANGDIRVRNNAGTGNGVLDDVRVQVVCAPAPNNTTRPNCNPGPATGQFDYSFTSGGVLWVLDQFTLTLTQNPPGAGLPTLLSSDELPTEAEWESVAWTAQQILLRFNPYGFDANNVAIPIENATGIVTFLAVPEPGTLALAGLALALLGAGGGLKRRGIRQ